MSYYLHKIKISQNVFCHVRKEGFALQHTGTVSGRLLLPLLLIHTLGLYLWEQRYIGLSYTFKPKQVTKLSTQKHTSKPSYSLCGGSKALWSDHQIGLWDVVNLQLWMYLHAVRNMKQLQKDSTAPEVSLNWHHATHLKDVTEQKLHGWDVTDCHTVRKRVLSCLLDVCPAGHAHRWDFS